VNHPARIAERVATLDLVSGGRVELGTGEGSSQAELGGFGVDRELKREQWDEALDAITRMFVEEPFAGHDGRFVKMPPRNVVPKPKQKPHPPLWVACSRRETILQAARKGIGALSFSFIEPEQAKEWVDEYYRLLASEECVPAGFAVNPNLAVVVPFMLHADEQTAIERGIDGAHFFGYSLAHYYVFGHHRPGRTNVWDEFQEHRDEYGFAREIVTAQDAPLGVNLLQQGLGSLRGTIGTPDQVAELIERYQAAGVDQVIFVGQAGRNRHEHICESIELFEREVLPRFADEADVREAAKLDRLAEAMEKALARRAPAQMADPAYEIAPQDEPRPAPMPALDRARPAWEVPSGGTVERPLVRMAAARVRTWAQRKGEAAFGAFIRGRSDEQLERTIGTTPGLRMIFKGMERNFQSAKTGGFTGDIQYELTAGDATRRWIVHITDEGISTRPGTSGAPAVTLRMAVPTFARIVSGEIRAALAFMEGRIELDGDFQVAAMMGEWFGQAAPF
jgi:alkanesulfonate monooxygenase SsuD/methylene tetrahydromethanopterin reductase-like flavin-dependent oxidoreductase (luciferase family)/putative sterol carrier protein